MKRIIMDVFFGLIRIAVTEDNKLIHYLEERETGTNNYGDIYLGRVENIKPGIQGAFVNIGSSKNALLHSIDIVDNEKKLPINKLLKKGQDIVVQIKKEAVGDKGARLTTRYSITGHYLVLLPTESKIYMSKKITNKKEKARLKSGVNLKKPHNCGIIIRTEAEGIDLEVINRELDYLVSRWKKVKTTEVAPKLLLTDVSKVIKTIRDNSIEDIDEIVVNESGIVDELKEYFNIYFPEYMNKIKYRKEYNLINKYGIGNQVAELYQRKVWLESGGYIIIDTTEACTVIDVNSGKYTGNKNINETFLKINLDATKLIADQIRLRNISGIILIDYINLKKKKHQKVVEDYLKECLKDDKVTTKVYGFTKLFMLEMTRKREDKTLDYIASEKCPICNLRGLIPNQETIFYRAADIIENNKNILKKGSITVKVNPYISDLLKEIKEKNRGFTFIDMVKDYYKVKVSVREDKLLNVDEIKILPSKIID